MDLLPPPQLCNVKKDDLPRIAQLEEEAFGAKALSLDAIEVLFDLSGGLWLLAADDEGTWGYSVNVRGEDARVGWIVGMVVGPERRRRGWGKCLLQATIDRLSANDMDTIRLLVAPDNKIARRLYELYGFHDTGDRIDHFGPGQSRMIMSLLLPARGEWCPGPEVPAEADVSPVTDETTCE